MCLAVPGKIVSVTEPPAGEADSLARTGRVDFGGVVKEANLSCVPDAGVGDYVIVHVGFAISRLDEAEAQETLHYLRLIGELNELHDEAAEPGAGRQ